MALGAALLVLGLAYLDEGSILALAGGIAGISLGLLYLRSPAWKMEVVVHEDALEVLSRGDRRFLLPWAQVVRLVASPGTSTCFVDGGQPDRSLLVPGPGASAPYDLEDKAALYALLVAHIPADRRVEVETLETARIGEPATGETGAAGAAGAPGADAEAPR